MENTEQTGAAEPRNDAPAEPAQKNENTTQDEFCRLASLPDRHEIRIVIAEEAGHVALGLRHEDFGKSSPLVDLLATGTKLAVVKISKKLSMVLNLAGCETQMKMKTESAR